jgi:hypothetical protein
MTRRQRTRVKQPLRIISARIPRKKTSKRKHSKATTQRAQHVAARWTCRMKSTAVMLWSRVHRR